MTLTQEHYDLQMRTVRDAAGLLRTVDLPVLISHAMQTRASDDLMTLMALNNARLHLPDPAPLPKKTPDSTAAEGEGG